MVLPQSEQQQNEPCSGSSSHQQQQSSPPPDANSNSQYECNICLDTARDAIISMCGHLFCWPCLHKWLETKPNNQTCPVCKSAISRDKVIPLYGRNSTDRKDPRDKIPPRPQGQRTEQSRNNLLGFGFEGLQVSFGIGAFPFSFLATTLNFNNDGRIPPPRPGTAEFGDDQFLSRIFLVIAIIFIICILLA